AMNPPEFSATSARAMRRKISAPLLDRFDLMIDVQPVDIEDIRKKKNRSSVTTADILSRVVRARQAQYQRLSGAGLHINAQMDVRSIEKLCPLDAASESLLVQAVRRLNLSMRAYHRMIKVARTIADLEGANAISQSHIAEALQYRQNVLSD
ncbi:magnesium chelatase, partial [Candidatus Peregrinibacteria bacterium CG10_big_fil_rev_8_21_14_0_10_54_7]